MSDDFLSRWSRRKRDPDAGRDEAAPSDPTPPALEALEGTDAEILEQLGLKHPEEMGAGDDFAAFLRSAVPQHLKTMALRRLWRSNPTLACLDGLNDYDTDYTGAGVAPGTLKTSYEVGRGILKRIAEVAEPVPEETAEALSAPVKAPPEIVAADDDTRAGAADGDTRARVPDGPAAAERATRRRMVFRSEG